MSESVPDEEALNAPVLAPLELIARVRASQPEAMLGLDERSAARLLRAAFHELRNAVDAMSTGTLAVPSLGRFHARQLEKDSAVPAQGARPRRVLFLTPQSAAAAKAGRAVPPVAGAMAVPAPAPEPSTADAAKPPAKSARKKSASNQAAPKKPALKSSSKGPKPQKPLPG